MAAQQNCVLGVPTPCEVFANLDIEVNDQVTGSDHLELKVSFTYLFHFPPSVPFRLPTAGIKRTPVLGSETLDLGNMQLTDIANTSVSATNYGYTLLTANFEYTYLWDLLDENQQPAQLLNLLNVTVNGVNSQVLQSQLVAHGVEQELAQKNCHTLKGNACSLLNGNYFLAQSDHRGTNGLSFTRYYNSLSKIAAGKNFDSWNSTGGSVILDWSFIYPDDSTSELLLYIDDMGRYEYLERSGSGGDFKGEDDLDYTLSKQSDGSYQITFADGRIDLFNNNGDLTKRVDSFGNQTTFERDGRRLVKMTNKDGHSLTFNYTDSKLSSITQPDGNLITYDYNTDGRLIRVNQPDNSWLSYRYDTNGYLDQVTRNDEKLVVNNSFDSVGRVLTHTDHIAGRSYQFNYETRLKEGVAEPISLSDHETVTQYTDSLGNSAIQVSSFGNSEHYLVSYEHTAGEDSNQTSYDVNGNPSRRTDAEGNIRTFNYNSFDQLLSETRGADTEQAQQTQYTYLNEHLDLITSMTKPSVIASSLPINEQNNSDVEEQYYVTETQYNAQNKPIKTIESGYDAQAQAISRITEFGYDTQGNLVLIDGKRSDVSDITQFEFNLCVDGNGCGQVTTITDAMGRQTQFEDYDSAGRVGKITYPNGLTAHYQYDNVGNVISTTLSADGINRQTSYEYELGLLTRITQPTGEELLLSYDQQQNLSQITDSAGHITTYEYDDNNNRINERKSDETGIQYTKEQTFDRLDQIDLVKGINGTQDIDLDKIGRLVKVTDALGRVTSMEYDALSRLKKETDAQQGTTNYQYNVHDQITQVTDALGNVTTYQYDDFGRKTSEQSSARGKTNYRYDMADNVIAMTDARGVEQSYQYDALNRLTHIDRPNDDEDISLSYDINGLVSNATHEAGQTQYQYNGFSELTTRIESLGSESYAFDYQYNSNGQITELTYPSGDKVKYQYSNNRITKVELSYGDNTQIIAENIRYQPFGPLAELTYGNGIEINKQYNSNYQTEQISEPNVVSRHYQYDAVDNVISVNQGNELSEHYQYDTLNRLTQAQISQESTEFTYDAIGNRVSKQNDTKLDNYNYDSASEMSGRTNYLSSIVNDNESVAIEYDAMGNIIVKGSQLFSYNQAGRLAETTLGSETTEYKYNYLGQRAVKYNHFGEEIHYFYNVSGQLLYEVNVNTAESKHYIWLEQQLLAINEYGINASSATPVNRTIYYAHANHINTVTHLTNSNGEIVWQAQYQAFGNIEVNSDVDGDGEHITFNLRFPGQYYDQESGLYYNYFRDYDPELGRYIQSDPIGLDGGINTYGYTGNNPVNDIDPSGLSAIPVVGPGPALTPAAHPVFIPGTKENDAFVESIIQISNLFGDKDREQSESCEVDNAGLKVSPLANTTEPPGQCSPREQQRLQQDVNQECKRPRKCTQSMSTGELFLREVANQRCAIARDKINKKCFMGGDKNHRNQANDAWRSMARCQSFQQ